MATIEREHERQRTPHELPVFVARDGRRARRLRFVAAGVGVLALLWLVGLAAGMLGFGRLPGLSAPLDRIGGPDKAQSNRSESKTQTPVRSSRRPAQLILASQARARARAATSTQPARAQAARQHGRAKSVARRPQPPPPTAVQPQPALTPPPQQGWARHGRPAPTGYTRRTQPQPAPPPPGQANAPGQTKKALQPAPPLPPPPPPPGNGGGSKKP